MVRVVLENETLSPINPKIKFWVNLKIKLINYYLTLQIEILAIENKLNAI